MSKLNTCIYFGSCRIFNVMDLKRLVSMRKLWENGNGAWLRTWNR